MTGAADNDKIIERYVIMLVQKFADDLVLIGYYTFYGRYYFFTGKVGRGDAFERFF